MSMAIGAVLLATSRPYEGILLCLPVAVVLARWALFGKNRPPLRFLVRRTVLPLVVLIAGAAWMGYYNYRAFGSPLTPPYTVNRATYAVTPYYARQSRGLSLCIGTKSCGNSMLAWNWEHSARSTPGPVSFRRTYLNVGRAFAFYAGIVLLVPLIMLRRVLSDRRVRFLLLCIPILMVGMSVETFLIPHYIAPFTAAFYAIGLQAMRHLRVWKPGGQPVGTTMVRLLVTV